jgi:hypothetical protein
LSDVKGWQKSWTRLFRLIPLIPNTLSVFTNDGTEYRFILPSQTAWPKAIDEQLNSD